MAAARYRVVALFIAFTTLVSATGILRASTAVRIAYPSGINAVFPIVIKQANLDEKQGWHGEFSQFQYGPPMMEALASGAVDVVVLTFMPVTSYLAKAPDTISFIADLGSFPFSLVVQKDLQATDLADLKAKKIGVSFGSDENLRILEALKASSVDSKDVLLNLPPADLPSAFASKIVDAIMIRQPQLDRVSTQLGGRIIKSWTVHSIVIGRSDFISSHPEIVKQLRASFADSFAFIKQHPSEASAWFATQAKTRPAFVEAALKTMTFPLSVGGGDALRADAKTWFATAYDLGMIKKPVSEGDFFR